MSLAAIRGSIVTVLSSVPGIGTVHAYERWAADWTAYLSFFKTEENKINGWTVSRRKTESDRDTMPTLNRRHRFIMRGYYGLKDSAATEHTFQALVEAVQDAFEDQYLLNGTVINSGPVQVQVFENRMFGNVLCHYAELELIAEERVTYS